MEKADHSGHRDRLRTKYLENGVESLAAHEVIELLLFNAVPYRNTNDIAKRLLDRFGSLSAVMDAPIDTLIEAGLTRNQAAFMKLIPDVTRLYMLDRDRDDDRIVDLSLLPDRIKRTYIGKMREEHLWILLVDIKMKELYSGIISDGSFGSTEVSVRRIMSLALNYGAAGVILVHNHPSGLALPSRGDFKSTEMIRDSLHTIGVELLDHYILADDECVSMRQSGLLD